MEAGRFRDWTSPYKGSFFVAELLGEQDIVLAGLRGNVWRSNDGGRAGANWLRRCRRPSPRRCRYPRWPRCCWASQAGFVLKLAADRLEPMHKQAPQPPINGLVLGERPSPAGVDRDGRVAAAAGGGDALKDLSCTRPAIPHLDTNFDPAIGIVDRASAVQPRGSPCWRSVCW
jgi:hypothetical protein